MSDFVNAYTVLGVDRSATPQEVQRAFRGLARQVHPDVNESPDAGAAFARLVEARDLLMDPARRAALDDALDLRTASDGAPQFEQEEEEPPPEGRGSRTRRNPRPRRRSRGSASSSSSSSSWTVSVDVNGQRVHVGGRGNATGPRVSVRVNGQEVHLGQDEPSTARDDRRAGGGPAESAATGATTAGATGRGSRLQAHVVSGILSGDLRVPPGHRYEILGIVSGDVHCSPGARVVVRGIVEGDVLCAPGGQVVVQGIVEGRVDGRTADVSLEGGLVEGQVHWS